MKVIMQSLAEKSRLRPTHKPANTHTVHPPHAQSPCLCHRHWFHMLVFMSNTHIERGEGAERRRGGGGGGGGGREEGGLGSGRELPRLLGRGRLVQQTMRGTGMGTGRWNAWACWVLFWVSVCLFEQTDGKNEGWLDEEEDEQERVLAPVPKRGNS